MPRMLNPITYTENVVEDFLRYQMTTYSFADPNLHRQMRQAIKPGSNTPHAAPGRPLYQPLAQLSNRP